MTFNLKIPYEVFLRIIDELYDEIIIYDNNYKIVYVNKACERHYGIKQEEMIGHSFWDFQEKYWDVSVLPYVYKEKKAVMQKQKTYLGSEILTIAIPLFDDKGEIEYVAMSVRDNFENRKISYLYDILNEDIGNKRDIKNTLIYRSDKMKEIINALEEIKDIPSPCLMLGETGVGKTLLGKHLFELSSRYNKAFVHLNCAAIHKDLIETELFGYEPGTFSGARKEGKKGLIEAANGGVLFLDEISEIPYHLQSKLLHFIQEMEFYPVGSIKPVKVDVKIIAATNRDLYKMVKMNSFREDLLYRLNVFEIKIPPLRDRKEDILPLANYFLNKYNERYDREHIFSEEVKDIFINYSWKGNTRELSHIIERLVVTVKDIIIMPYHLPKHLFEIQDEEKCDYNNLSDAITDVERRMVTEAYNELKSTRKVAKKLGVSQSTASRLVRKYIGTEDKKE